MMQYKQFLLIISIIAIYEVFTIIGASATSGLQAISDDDLVERMKSNEFLIALFSKGSAECKKYETELLKVREDFTENFPADVVKIMNSNLVRLYKPSKEPALIFFRHGVPLLYDGAINAEEIYQRFEQNQVPVVKELTDDSFEHLTQASTGSTTGDWFIQFYTRNCIDCQRLSATWEGVGAALKNRANVAKVDKEVRGAKTAKRFNIQKAPEFIFIRQGKFYRYEIAKYDVKSFVSFAQEFYRNARAEPIKTPSSPFDEIVSSIVAYLKSYQANGINNIISDNGHLVPIITIIGFILFVVLLKCCYRSKKTAAADIKDKNKKSK